MTINDIRLFLVGRPNKQPLLKGRESYVLLESLIEAKQTEPEGARASASHYHLLLAVELTAHLALESWLRMDTHTASNTAS